MQPADERRKGLAWGSRRDSFPSGSAGAWYRDLKKCPRLRSTAICFCHSWKFAWSACQMQG